jgi:hypothetical protein
MLDKTLSRLSAETRWTSAMSLLIRDITSPSLVRPKSRRQCLEVAIERQAHVKKLPRPTLEHRCSWTRYSARNRRW